MEIQKGEERPGVDSHQQQPNFSRMSSSMALYSFIQLIPAEDEEEQRLPSLETNTNNCLPVCKAEKTKKGANTQLEGARIALLLYSGQCVCINT